MRMLYWFFDPLDPDFIVVGAAAGLFGAIIAGAVVALFATSPFVVGKDVACYEPSSDDCNILFRDRPIIAARIMRNMAREPACRLPRTSEHLRNAAS